MAVKRIIVHRRTSPGLQQHHELLEAVARVYRTDPDLGDLVAEGFIGGFGNEGSSLRIRQ